MTETVVEPVAEAPVETAEPITPVESPESKAQQRINELTRKTKDLEWQLQEAKKPPPEPKAELKAPTLEQSGYDETKHKQAMDAYYEALIDRRAEEKVEKVLTERETKAKAQTRDERFAESFGKLSETERSTASQAIVTEFAANLIKESELGPALALHLGQNPELAEQIARLPDYLQAREIGKLEARLETQTATPVEKPVSKAPPPVPRLEATEPVTRVSASDPESDKLSDAEWKRAREKQLKRR